MKPYPQNSLSVWRRANTLTRASFKRNTFFGHIFGGGYAAGYYVYRWAEVLNADAFQAFKDSGDLFHRELARDFRNYILAKNALYEGIDAYVRFRGQEPDIEPFLRRAGLK